MFSSLKDALSLSLKSRDAVNAAKHITKDQQMDERDVYRRTTAPVARALRGVHQFSLNGFHLSHALRINAHCRCWLSIKLFSIHVQQA